MRSFRHCIAPVVTLLISCLVTFAATSEETGDTLEDRRDELAASLEEVEKKLAQSGFFEELAVGAFAAAAPVIAIEAPEKIAHYGKGESGRRYDVVLQPGHYPRTSGATGVSYTTKDGVRVSEQAIATYLSDRIATALAERDVTVLVIPADGFARPLQTKVFLSLHGDGSEPVCKTGPSMGYDDPSDMLGVHSIGFALATALGYNHKDWMPDGFTANLRNYYAFKHMNTEAFEGVLEVGDLRCPEDIGRITQNIDKIAHNLAVALRTSVELTKADQ